MQQYVNSIVAGTFDLGVEFALNRIAPTSFGNLFPWYHPLSDGESSAESHAGDEAVALPRPRQATCLAQDEWEVPDMSSMETVVLSFEAMLATPGPLHIIDNMSASLLDNVPYLFQGVEKLKAVANWLVQAHVKKRLVSTCFKAGIAQAFQVDIQKFQRKVDTGRWGSVAFAIPALLEIQTPLTRFWSLDAYGAKPETSSDIKTGVKMEIVDGAINSPVFWAQLRTLEALFSVVRELIEWVEACPCHHGRKPPVGKTQCWRQCPLRARRLPEIASGALLQILHELCFTNAATLFLALDAAEAEVRTACLHDFERGRGHLAFQLTLKLSCFLEPPLLLFAAAAPEMSKIALHKCLVSTSSHPQIQRLKTGQLAAEAQMYVVGNEDVRVLPDSAAFLGELRFAWGSERKIEGGARASEYHDCGEAESYRSFRLADDSDAGDQGHHLCCKRGGPS